MTPRDRMLAALRLQPVDRVPHATYNLNPYGDNEHTRDATYAGLLDKVRQSAGVWHKIRCGGVGVDLGRPREGLIETRVEGRGDDRTRATVLHTPKGDLTSFTRIPEHKPARTLKPLIVSDEDAERFMSLPYEAPEWDVSRVRSFIEAAGEGGAPWVMYDEPFHAACRLYDFEDFCMRWATDPAGLLKIIDWHHERAKESLRALCRALKGLTCVLHTGGVEVCTPPMLPPSLFRRVITPRLTELTRIIHDSGHYAGVHCHGRVRHVLPEIIQAGTDLLEPIEPPDQGDISLAELLDLAKGKLCLVGYIQDQEFYTGRPGHMTRRVEEIARVVNGRTGYVMTPTCTPFEHPCSETYRANYMEWLVAAERVLGA